MTISMQQELEFAARWWGDLLRNPPGWQDIGNKTERDWEVSLIGTLIVASQYRPIPEDKIAAFEAALIDVTRAWIEKCGTWDVTRPMFGRGLRVLEVDYHPNHLLQQALDAAGITRHHLPIKTCMCVNPGYIEAARGYSAKFEVVWGSQP